MMAFDPWDFGSVCSGIEAATVAFEPLGLVPAWFSEIEKFPNALLRHYYQNVPNLGDMTRIPELLRSGQIRSPRVICGGTPCQSFSFGGLGESLSDPRGQLTLTFCEIVEANDAARAIRRLEPCGVFWENVPGVLNKKDNPFGCFLGKLAGEVVALQPPGGRWSNAGCIVGPKRVLAWRVLDAQFFGLAQRRERVFVVGSSRNGFDPVKVLFEPESLRRNSPPSRSKGERASSDAPQGVGASNSGFSSWWNGEQVRQTIDAVVAKRQTMPDKNRFPAVLVPEVAPTLDTMHNRKLGSNQWVNAGFAVITPAITQNPYGDNESREGLLVAHTLTGEGHDASEDGTGRGTPIIPVFSLQAGIDRDGEGGPNGAGIQQDIAYTLEARPTMSKVQAVAFSASQDGADVSEVSPTLRAGGGDRQNGGGQVGVAMVEDALAFQTRIARNGRGAPSEIASTLAGPRMAVRRLTPRECERLQGFPDDYTLIPRRQRDEKKPAKKSKVQKQPRERDPEYLAYLERGGRLSLEECKTAAADGPRYKAIGNSWAINCVRWIGRRLFDHLRQLSEGAEQ